MALGDSGPVTGEVVAVLVEGANDAERDVRQRAVAALGDIQ
jgi:HEAT repeat protein